VEDYKKLREYEKEKFQEMVKQVGVYCWVSVASIHAYSCVGITL